MKISEIITDKYKLRIPPTVYYELLADVQEVEEPTDKNDCETCIHNKGFLECDMYGCKYESTTKNNLGVDCISRKAALDITWNDPSYSDPLNVLTEVRDKIRELPSVPPQEPQTFKWCTDCREYDQEKHCCHRWSKVIRNTVEEMKQEYIERDVLDKIDEIITDALDKSTDQKESQTLRWVLDKISEVG